MWNVGTSKAKIGGSVMFAEGKQKVSCIATKCLLLGD